MDCLGELNNRELFDFDDSDPQLMWMPLSIEGLLISFCPLLPLVLAEESDSSGLGIEPNILLLPMMFESESRSMLSILYFWDSLLVTAPGLRNTPSCDLLVEAIEASDATELAGEMTVGDSVQKLFEECNIILALSRLSSSFSSSFTSS